MEEIDVRDHIRHVVERFLVNDLASLVIDYSFFQPHLEVERERGTLNRDKTVFTSNNPYTWSDPWASVRCLNPFLPRKRVRFSLNYDHRSYDIKIGVSRWRGDHSVVSMTLRHVTDAVVIRGKHKFPEKDSLKLIVGDFRLQWIEIEKSQDDRIDVRFGFGQENILHLLLEEKGGWYIWPFLRFTRLGNGPSNPVSVTISDGIVYRRVPIGDGDCLVRRSARFVENNGDSRGSVYHWSSSHKQKRKRAE